MKQKGTRQGLLVIIALFTTLLAGAQKANSIAGAVQDSSGKPLVYATVELFGKQPGATALKVVSTNDKGAYRFQQVDTGSYRIIISHTGYTEISQEVRVNGSPVELSPTRLQPASRAMQGVVVTARKPLIEQSDDKIIFNVEADPTSKTESAIDILRKTPFVSVDGENNIQVNGQTNFRVLLNGRETAMFAQNVKEALKGFPGALITKIEVITTPSAKYDAEGVGGIINIITKKKVVGYNGSLNTWYTNIGWYNVNANFSAKFGKVGMTLNYGAGGGVNVEGRNRTQTIPLVPSPFTSRLLLGNRNMTNFWNFGNAEVNWELDTLNTVSFYGNVSGGWNRNRLSQTITTAYNTGDSVSLFNLESRNEYPTNSVGADYIRKFSSHKEKEFSIRLNTEFGNSNSFLNSFMDNEQVLDRYVINNSEAKNVQYTLQSDYILPLKGTLKLETGLKGIFRRAHSDFESLVRTNSVEDYKLSRENTDFFEYDQNVYSGYGSFSMKKGKTTFRLGGRVEHTTVRGNFDSSGRAVKQDYTNLLPNLQATTRISNAFTMVTTYSQRIQRPFIHNLNPFRNNNDPKNISFGNPDLEPQVIHSLSVQTRLNKGGTFAGLTFTGSYSDNMIVQYSSFDSLTGVTSTTSGNIGKEVGVSANGNISAKITPSWSVFINGNLRWSYVRNRLMPSQTNSGFGGNANMNTTYTINKRFNVSSYAGFFRNAVTIQTRYPLNLWYGIGAGYKFFNEKLTATLGLSNFFEKERDFSTVTRDPAFEFTSTSTMPFRGFSIALSWSFGKLTENVSKKKGVSNDDLLSTSN